ncbi:MAG: T9SS type A sorting domain-containing protein [Candidatus Zixiibacteriota bacterium]|jgi:hypothetical protein
MRNVYFVAAIALVAVASAWGDGWALETITPADMGKGCALAIDTKGDPHISFLDSTGLLDNVVYARIEDEEWFFEIVATDVAVDGTTAITLDPYDRPYIAYCDKEDEKLVYAYRTVESWHYETIAEGTRMGASMSFGPWPYGYGALTYDYEISQFNTALVYAVREAEDTWNVETVVSGSNDGSFNTLMVDSTETPHVVYVNRVEQKIKHALYDGTEWVIEDVDDGTDCSAVMTPDDVIHVAYTAPDNSVLKYAHLDGGTWATEDIEAATQTPAYTDICITSTGEKYISYYSWAKLNLRVVTDASGTWKRKVVASGDFAGLPHSMSVAHETYPSIAFYHANPRKLKYAWYDVTLGLELESFTARRGAEGADVRWRVGDSDGVAGYNLYRETRDGVREKANAGLITGASPFLYVDEEAGPAAYDYWLEAVSTAGTTEMYGPAALPSTGSRRAFALYQNAPNPVRDFTTFSFSLAEASDVRLVIYDTAGRRVAAAAEGRYEAGSHDVGFRNDLPPGVYVYRLEAGEDSAAGKMVVSN